MFCACSIPGPCNLHIPYISHITCVPCIIKPWSLQIPHKSPQAHPNLLPRAESIIVLEELFCLEAFHRLLGATRLDTSRQSSWLPFEFIVVAPKRSSTNHQGEVHFCKPSLDFFVGTFSNLVFKQYPLPALRINQLAHI